MGVCHFDSLLLTLGESPAWCRQKKKRQHLFWNFSRFCLSALVPPSLGSTRINCLPSFKPTTPCARCLPLENTGNNNAASIPMIAMTTKSSMPDRAGHPERKTRIVQFLRVLIHQHPQTRRARRVDRGHLAVGPPGCLPAMRVAVVQPRAIDRQRRRADVGRPAQVARNI